MKKNQIIRIQGAAEHNLKKIDLDIPKEQLVLITGLSGSGKSSLAFDTIYAEGQRRYIESLSSYARQFLGQMEKPKVESIEGLTPTIAIEQRTTQATPRSTVATSTEIYDYLRVLFARAGQVHCPVCFKPISVQSVQAIVDTLMTFPQSTKVQILAPIIQSRKGEHREVLNLLKKDAWQRLRIDGTIYAIDELPTLKKSFAHSIEVVVDRLLIKPANIARLFDSTELALKTGQGICMVLWEKDQQEQVDFFSEYFSCPEHGSFLTELSPRVFSFNSPFGACPECSGLGNLLELEESLVVPNPNISLAQGAIEAWKRCGSGLRSFYRNSVIALANMHDVSVDTPWKDLPEKVRKQMLHGSKIYQGILPHLKKRFRTSDSAILKERIHEFMTNQVCDKCHGTRLKKAVLTVTLADKNIAQITQMTVKKAVRFFEQLALTKEQAQIAKPLVHAVTERLQFLWDVGLDYVTLDRTTRSLSGGEAQRIKLASQIGAKLSGITYVLDEPTIGLHQRDNDRLLFTLKKLKGLGNTVIVVEHDEDAIKQADFIVDLGPKAGKEGGQVVAKGNYKQIIKEKKSLTGQYLSGALSIELPKKRRTFDKQSTISILGCAENNLQNIDVTIPLQLFTCVTGVSGAGKSTLIMDCFGQGLQKELGDWKVSPGKYRSMQGQQKIERVVFMDQSPIGRTSRSNPATYTGSFDFIRQLFAQTAEAKARGYERGRFSFNVKGGRCEECQGQGYKTIEMHFLADVNLPCEACLGSRYNRETLAVRFKGKNIAEVLAMTVFEACDFFENHRYIYPYMEIMRDVGLGYLQLGQASTSLSGGEAQRIKLCSELARKNVSKILYIMDEPTTGLHFHDIAKLITLIQRLVDRGNSVVVIEHNLDMIKSADWVIDIGPEGGSQGGTIVAAGTPEQVCQVPNSYTGQYLKQKLFDVA